MITNLKSNIAKMRAPKKAHKPQIANGFGKAPTVNESLAIAAKFQWLPKGLYDHIMSHPDLSEAAKPRAVLMARFHFSKLYSQFKYNQSNPELEYVTINSLHWKNICTQAYTKQIQNALFVPYTITTATGKVIKPFVQGKKSMKYKFIEPFSTQLLEKSKQTPNLSHSLKKALNIISESADEEQRRIDAICNKNPIAKRHFENHLRWITPIRKKLDEMDDYQPIVDFLISEGMKKEEAIQATCRFVAAAYREYLSTEDHARRFIDAGFDRFSRVHTPSNILKKNIEAFLIAEDIYRADIVSCHIAILAAISEDENLIADIENNIDVYTKLCPTNRKWAKERLLILINDREFQTIKNDELVEKILPLQRQFEKYYPTAAKYLAELKSKNISFSTIGTEIEQQFFKRAIEILKDNPLLDEIKFEHDGIASLNIEAIKAFEEALKEVLTQEWAEPFTGLIRIKTSVTKLNEELRFTEEDYDIDSQDDNDFCVFDTTAEYMRELKAVQIALGSVASLKKTQQIIKEGTNNR